MRTYGLCLNSGLAENLCHLALDQVLSLDSIKQLEGRKLPPVVVALALTIQGIGDHS